MSRDIDWSDEDLLPAISEVRDFDQPTDWCLFYCKERGKRTCAVTVKAKGEGGLDEMTSYLRDDEILFGFISIPVNDTQKLAFLIWIGENTPFSLRAGIIYHQASIAQFFQPYTLQLQASRVEELEWNIYGRLEGSGVFMHSHSLRRKHYSEKRASRTLYAKSARGFWSGQADEDNRTLITFSDTMQKYDLKRQSTALMKRFKRARNGTDQVENGEEHDDAPSRLVRGAITHRDQIRAGDDSLITEREKAKALFLSMGLETPLFLPLDRRDSSNSNLLHLSAPIGSLHSENGRADLIERTITVVSTSSSSLSSSPSDSACPPTASHLASSGNLTTATAVQNLPMPLLQNGILEHKVDARIEEDKREEAQDQTPVAHENGKDDSKKAQDHAPARAERNSSPRAPRRYSSTDRLAVALPQDRDLLTNREHEHEVRITRKKSNSLVDEVAVIQKPKKVRNRSKSDPDTSKKFVMPISKVERARAREEDKKKSRKKSKEEKQKEKEKKKRKQKETLREKERDEKEQKEREKERRDKEKEKDSERKRDKRDHSAKNKDETKREQKDDRSEEKRRHKSEDDKDLLHARSQNPDELKERHKERKKQRSERRNTLKDESANHDSNHISQPNTPSAHSVEWGENSKDKKSSSDNKRKERPSLRASSGNLVTKAVVDKKRRQSVSGLTEAPTGLSLSEGHKHKERDKEGREKIHEKESHKKKDKEDKKHKKKKTKSSKSLKLQAREDPQLKSPESIASLPKRDKINSAPSFPVITEEPNKDAAQSGSERRKKKKSAHPVRTKSVEVSPRRPIERKIREKPVIPLVEIPPSSSNTPMATPRQEGLAADQPPLTPHEPITLLPTATLTSMPASSGNAAKDDSYVIAEAKIAVPKPHDDSISDATSTSSTVPTENRLSPSIPLRRASISLRSEHPASPHTSTSRENSGLNDNREKRVEIQTGLHVRSSPRSSPHKLSSPATTDQQQDTPKNTNDGFPELSPSNKRSREPFNQIDDETIKQEKTRVAFAAIANDDNAILLSILRKGQEEEPEVKEKIGALGILRRNAKRRSKDQKLDKAKEKEKDKDDEKSSLLKKLFLPSIPTLTAQREQIARRELTPEPIDASKTTSDSLLAQANQHLHREQNPLTARSSLPNSPLATSSRSVLVKRNLVKSAVANALAQSQTIIRLTERKMTVPGADPPPRTVYDGVLSSDSICSDEMRRILSDSSFFTAREKDMQTFAELKLEKMQKIETAKAALLLLPPESPQAKTPPMSAKATPHPGSLSVDNSPVHKNKEPFNPNPTAETKLSLDMIKSLQKIVFDSSDDEKEGASSTSHGGSESETERQTKRIRRKKRRKNTAGTFRNGKLAVQVRKRSTTLPDISSQSLVETVSSVISSREELRSDIVDSPRSQLIIDLAKKKSKRKKRRKKDSRSKRKQSFSRDDSSKEREKDHIPLASLISAEDLKARVVKLEEARLARQGRRMSLGMIKALEVPQVERVEKVIKYSVGVVPARTNDANEQYASTKIGVHRDNSGFDPNAPGRATAEAAAVITERTMRHRAHTATDVTEASSEDSDNLRRVLSARAASETCLGDKKIVTPNSKQTVSSPRLPDTGGTSSSPRISSTRKILRRISRTGRGDSSRDVSERQDIVDTEFALKQARKDSNATDPSADEAIFTSSEVDVMEILRTTTPQLSRQERKLLAKQKEKEEKERRKQEKKRLREDKKLDKLISDRHKAKKHTLFLPFSIKKVDSQPHFSAGDKTIGALWYPREQMKRRKEGKLKALERELKEHKRSSSDIHKRESSDKLPSSSGEVVIWERAEDGSLYSMDDSSNTMTSSTGSERYIPRLNFRPRPSSYSYVQENSRMGPLPSPLPLLRKIGSTPHAGAEDTPPPTLQQNTSTSNSQSTSPRVSDLESPSHYSRRPITRNSSAAGEDPDDTGAEELSPSLISVSPGTRSTPRAQQKQRLWEELKREKERIARIKVELERMEEQKEERPTRRQLRQAESLEEALLKYDELIIEEPEPSPGIREGEKEYRKIFRGKYRGVLVKLELISVPSPEQGRSLFNRELGTLRDLNHPNICRVLGAALKDDREGYLATEYSTDATLQELLETDTKKLTWRLRLKMAKDIASALVYLHSKKLVHRDIRSHNMRVSANFRVKLCDFGFARKLSAKPPGLRTSIKGNEMWLSPEVIMGENSDQRADIFSLGVVFWEIMSRKDGRNFRRIVDEGYSLDCLHIIKNFISEDAPSGWIRLARDCCSIDPTARPLGRQLLSRLDEIETNLPFEDHLGLLLNHLQTFDRAFLRNTRTADRSAPILVNPSMMTLLTQEIRSFRRQNLRTAVDQQLVKSSLSRDVYAQDVIERLSGQLERLIEERNTLADENKQLKEHNQKMKTQIERFIALLK